MKIEIEKLDPKVVAELAVTNTQVLVQVIEYLITQAQKQTQTKTK